MTLAVSRKTTITITVPEVVILVQERRRSNAAGLHYGRPRGNRKAVARAAIDESMLSFGDEGDDDE